MSRLDRIADWGPLAALAGYNAARLAAQRGVTYEQLRRHFARRFGAAPQAFLDELRLSQAAAHLRSSRLSIKEIAGKLGFADPSQFCHRFRARFGCSPGEYAARFRLSPQPSPSPAGPCP